MQNQSQLNTHFNSVVSPTRSYKSGKSGKSGKERAEIRHINRIRNASANRNRGISSSQRQMAIVNSPPDKLNVEEGNACMLPYTNYHPESLDIQEDYINQDGSTYDAQQVLNTQQTYFEKDNEDEDMLGTMNGATGENTMNIIDGNSLNDSLEKQDKFNQTIMIKSHNGQMLPYIQCEGENSPENMKLCSPLLDLADQKSFTKKNANQTQQTSVSKIIRQLTSDSNGYECQEIVQDTTKKMMKTPKHEAIDYQQLGRYSKHSLQHFVGIEKGLQNYTSMSSSVQISPQKILDEPHPAIQNYSGVDPSQIQQILETEYEIDNYEQVDDTQVQNYLSHLNRNQFAKSSFIEPCDNLDGAPGVNADLDVGHFGYQALQTEEIHDQQQTVFINQFDHQRQSSQDKRSALGSMIGRQSALMGHLISSGSLKQRNLSRCSTGKAASFLQMSNSRPELQRVDEGAEGVGQIRKFDLLGKDRSDRGEQRSRIGRASEKIRHKSIENSLSTLTAQTNDRHRRNQNRHQAVRTPIYNQQSVLNNKKQSLQQPMIIQMSSSNQISIPKQQRQSKQNLIPNFNKSNRLITKSQDYTKVENKTPQHQRPDDCAEYMDIPQHIQQLKTRTEHPSPNQLAITANSIPQNTNKTQRMQQIRYSMNLGSQTLLQRDSSAISLHRSRPSLTRNRSSNARPQAEKEQPSSPMDQAAQKQAKQRDRQNLISNSSCLSHQIQKLASGQGILGRKFSQKSPYEKNLYAAQQAQKELFEKMQSQAQKKQKEIKENLAKLYADKSKGTSQKYQPVQRQRQQLAKQQQYQVKTTQTKIEAPTATAYQVKILDKNIKAIQSSISIEKIAAPILTKTTNAACAKPLYKQIQSRNPQGSMGISDQIKLLKQNPVLPAKFDQISSNKSMLQNHSQSCYSHASSKPEKQTKTSITQTQATRPNRKDQIKKSCLNANLLAGPRSNNHAKIVEKKVYMYCNDGSKKNDILKGMYQSNAAFEQKSKSIEIVPKCPQSSKTTVAHTRIANANNATEQYQLKAGGKLLSPMSAISRVSGFSFKTQKSKMSTITSVKKTTKLMDENSEMNQAIELVLEADQKSQECGQIPESLDEIVLQLPNNYQSKEGTRNESLGPEHSKKMKVDEDGGYITFTNDDSNMFVENQNVELALKRKQDAIRVSRQSFNQEDFKVQQTEEEQNLSANICDQELQEELKNEEEARRILNGLISHTTDSGENQNQVSRNTITHLHQQQNTAPDELDRRHSSGEDLVGELVEVAPKCNVGLLYHSEQMQNLQVIKPAQQLPQAPMIMNALKPCSPQKPTPQNRERSTRKSTHRSNVSGNLISSRSKHTPVKANPVAAAPVGDQYINPQNTNQTNATAFEGQETRKIRLRQEEFKTKAWKKAKELGNSYMRYNRDSRSLQRQAQQKNNMRKSVGEYQAGPETAKTIVSLENTQKTCMSGMKEMNDTSKTVMSMSNTTVPPTTQIENDSQPVTQVKQTKTPITRPKEVYSSKLYELLDSPSQASPEKAKPSDNLQLPEEHPIKELQSAKMDELSSKASSKQEIETCEVKAKRSKQQYLNTDKRNNKRKNSCKSSKSMNSSPMRIQRKTPSQSSKGNNEMINSQEELPQHQQSFQQFKDSLRYINKSFGPVLKGYKARRIYYNNPSIRKLRIEYRDLIQFAFMLQTDMTEINEKVENDQIASDELLKLCSEIDIVKDTLSKTLSDMKHKRVEFVNYFNQLLDSNVEWLKGSEPRVVQDILYEQASQFEANMLSYRNRKVQELCKVKPFDQCLGRELTEIQPFSAACNPHWQQHAHHGDQTQTYFNAAIESPKKSPIDTRILSEESPSQNEHLQYLKESTMDRIPKDCLQPQEPPVMYSEPVSQASVSINEANKYLNLPEISVQHADAFISAAQQERIMEQSTAMQEVKYISPLLRQEHRPPTADGMEPSAACLFSQKFSPAPQHARSNAGSRSARSINEALDFVPTSPAKQVTGASPGKSPFVSRIPRCSGKRSNNHSLSRRASSKKERSTSRIPNIKRYGKFRSSKDDFDQGGQFDHNFAATFNVEQLIKQHDEVEERESLLGTIEKQQKLNEQFNKFNDTLRSSKSQQAVEEAVEEYHPRGYKTIHDCSHYDPKDMDSFAIVPDRIEPGSSQLADRLSKRSQGVAEYKESEAYRTSESESAPNLKKSDHHQAINTKNRQHLSKNSSRIAIVQPQLASFRGNYKGSVLTSQVGASSYLKRGTCSSKKQKLKSNAKSRRSKQASPVKSTSPVRRFSPMKKSARKQVNKENEAFQPGPTSAFTTLQPEDTEHARQKSPMHNLATADHLQATPALSPNTKNPMRRSREQRLQHSTKRKGATPSVTPREFKQQSLNPTVGLSQETGHFGVDALLSPDYNSKAKNEVNQFNAIEEVGPSQEQTPACLRSNLLSGVSTTKNSENVGKGPLEIFANSQVVDGTDKSVETASLQSPTQTLQQLQMMLQSFNNTKADGGKKPKMNRQDVLSLIGNLQSQFDVMLQSDADQQ